MNIGEKILKYRKMKGYSQEDIANNLNVSRQTVSKWETNQSTPDFNKIIPLCNLFGISADELLNDLDNNVRVNDDKKIDVDEEVNEYKNKGKFALFICISVFLYFVSVMWIIMSEEIGIPGGIGVSIFLGIIGIATVIIIYGSIMYKKDNKLEEIENGENVNPKVKQINRILSLLFTIIYLLVSFLTMAWHITWIIWIVYALCEEIVKVFYQLGGK